MDSIFLDNVFTSFRRFCCFATYFPIYLQFGPSVQKYVWQAGNRRVIFNIFSKTNIFLLLLLLLGLCL